MQFSLKENAVGSGNKNLFCLYMAEIKDHNYIGILCCVSVFVCEEAF
jgi:hypothetical protein